VTRHLVTQATGSAHDGWWIALADASTAQLVSGNGVALVDTGASEVRQDGARAEIWTLDLDVWRATHPEARLIHDGECDCAYPYTSGRGLCAGAHCDRCGRPIEAGIC